MSETTRTNRTPAFWGYPPPPHDYPYCLFIEFAKISNFLILKQILHTKRLLKLLGKMCKYEMDPASIVEDTHTDYRADTILSTDGQTDRQTDGWKDRRTRWNQYTPFQLPWSGGIMIERVTHGGSHHQYKAAVLPVWEFPSWRWRQFHNCLIFTMGFPIPEKMFL